MASASKTSNIWNFFNIDVSRPECANCKLCYSVLIRGNPLKPSQFTTSPLIKHLKTIHPSSYKEFLNPKSECTAPKLNSESSKKVTQIGLQEMISLRNQWAIDEPSSIKIHKLIGLMIAEDLLPYSFVDNNGFRNLMAEVAPRYQVPSRKYFTERVIPNIFEKIRSNLILALKQADAFSFTTDLWTSQHTTISYMCVTAHWLTSEFQRHCALLICEQFEGQHTGKNNNFIIYLNLI